MQKRIPAKNYIGIQSEPNDIYDEFKSFDVPENQAPPNRQDTAFFSNEFEINDDDDDDDDNRQLAVAASSGGCCSDWWIAVVVILVVLASAGLIGGVLLFDPEFIYGNGTTPVTPTPPPPTSAPTPAPTPPTPFPSPTPMPFPNIGPCCNINLTNAGCSVTAITMAVCDLPGYAYCCTEKWDRNCISKSLLLGLQTCASNDCCTPSTSAIAGCDNLAIQTSVCAVDATCCTRAWDKTCVGIALNNGLQICSPFSCCMPSSNTQGCADSQVTQAVCNISRNCCWKSWSADCVGIALQYGILQNTVCSPQPCCISGLPNSVTGLLAQGCNDPPVMQMVCRHRPSCCRWQWTDTCASDMLALYANGSIVGTPKCIGLPTNDCCNISARGGCNSLDFMHKVCVLAGAEECCGSPHGWSRECISIARSPLRYPQNGTVIPAHSGVPNLACDFDSCCLSHARAGCKNVNVTTEVCATMPSCCAVAWTSECVKLAYQVIETKYAANLSAVCPEISQRDCCAKAESAGCGNIDIMRTVCFGAQNDTHRGPLPSCCDTLGGWRDICIESAISTGLTVCSNQSCCALATPTSVASQRKGCNNGAVMKRVCREIASCCQTGLWGLDCVEAAVRDAVNLTQCQAPPGLDYTQPCCSVGAYAGCSDLNVVKHVCQRDPACCGLAWTSDCVTLAITSGALVCNNDSTCFSANYAAGCQSPLIQARVCNAGTATSFINVNNNNMTSPQNSTCPLSLPLTAELAEDFADCCKFECSVDADCSTYAACVGNRCCTLNNANVCIGCGCLDPVNMSLPCSSSASGQYYCPAPYDVVDKATCVVYNNGADEDDFIQCCLNPICYDIDNTPMGWNSQCAAAALCLSTPDVLPPGTSVASITTAQLSNPSVPCCTPMPGNGLGGCDVPDIARRVCGGYLSDPDALLLFSPFVCCQNASNTDQANFLFLPGWDRYCSSLIPTFGIGTCSSQSCCDGTVGSIGCNNATVTQALCQLTDTFVSSIDGELYTYQFCCELWQPECVTAAENLGLISC